MGGNSSKEGETNGVDTTEEKPSLKSEDREDDGCYCFFCPPNTQKKQSSYDPIDETLPDASVPVKIVQKSLDAKSVVSKFGVEDETVASTGTGRPSGMFPVAVGNSMFKSGNYKEAIQHYEKELQEQSENADEQDPYDRIGTLTNLGTAYFNCKEYSKAIVQYEAALSEYEKVGRDNNELNIASLWMKVGNIYMMQKNYDMAEKTYRDALEAKQQVLKNDSHSEILLIQHSLALVCCKRHDYDEGMSILKDILEKKKKDGAVDDDSNLKGKTLLDMSGICMKRRSGTKESNKEEAKELCIAAKELLEETDLPENHPYMRQLRKLESKLL